MKKRTLSALVAFCLLFGIFCFYKAPAVHAQADTIELDYADYFNRVMDGSGSADCSVVTKDGRRALKVVPLPYGENFKKEIVLDSWSFDTAGIDLAVYKYMTVEYFYEGELPVESGLNMTATFTTLGGALTAYSRATSLDKIKTGSWETGEFVLTLGGVLSNTSPNTLKQIHLRVTHGIPAEAFRGNEAFYIGKITFYKNNPSFEVDNEPDVIALDFNEYHNGFVGNGGIATKEIKDGKPVVKFVPDTNYPDSQIVEIGYSYLHANIDLRKYKYMAISYYVDGTLPAQDARITVSGTGEPFAKDSGGSYNYVKRFSGWLSANKWSMAGLTLDFGEHLDPELDGIARSFHIRICDGYTVSQLSGVNAVYINKIIFSTEPCTGWNIDEGYLEGYGDGTFRPNAPMTRAEAAALFARMYADGESGVPTNLTSKFTDVSSSTWYGKYVAYVESLGGYISFPEGEFHPDREITREEFSQLLARVIMKKNGVTMTVPAYTADGNDMPLTRADAVILVNDMLGNTVMEDYIKKDIPYAFEDLSRDHYAYSEICNISIPHIQRSNGDWVSSVTHPRVTYGGDGRIDLTAGAAKVAEVDTLAKNRINEIKNTATSVNVSGTKYYVSNSGSDSNDGKSPERPWKTLSKVNSMSSSFKSGDGVFFKRGDMWRGEKLSVDVAGMTFSAYGTGSKPILNGSQKNAADPSLWTLVDSTNHIYRYAEKLVDVGSIFLNPESSNPQWGYKEVPDWNGTAFFVRGSNYSKVFDYKTELDRDLEFFSEVKAMSVWENTGYLYFRCDKGNPGNVFDTIEIGTHYTMIDGSAHNRTFDNLCIKYVGAHGIGSGTTKNLTVQNCEFGWIGGCILYYSGAWNDGAVRYGNAVQIYGVVDGYYVDNCYIYQCYDTGITHQYAADTGDLRMDNIEYTNNVIEDCIWSIEYWLCESEDGTAVREGENFLIENNILRRAGYGFGLTRPNGNESTHIHTGGYRQKYKPGTFVIRNNIFDRSSAYLLRVTAEYPLWLPDFEGNTYIQMLDGILGYYDGPRRYYYNTADLMIEYEYGDKSADVYYVGDEFKAVDPFAK